MTKLSVKPAMDALPRGPACGPQTGHPALAHPAFRPCTFLAELLPQCPAQLLRSCDPRFCPSLWLPIREPASRSPSRRSPSRRSHTVGLHLSQQGPVVTLPTAGPFGDPSGPGHPSWTSLTGLSERKSSQLPQKETTWGPATQRAHALVL